MKLLNFGSLNYDYVYRVAHIALPGETIASTDMQTFAGGKGLNQSIALAKAGVAVYHAGMVGEEGDGLLSQCRLSGVNTSYIKKVEGKSGHTIIQVDERAQNCIILYGGSNRKITKEFVDGVLAHFEEGDWLLLQNEISELPYLIERAYARGMKIVLNPSPYNGTIDLCDLSKISLFLINEIEGAQITGEESPEKILDQMLQSYPESAVVLTLGSRGAVYATKAERYEQGIFMVEAVDTTAAGDTFTGFFLASVLAGRSVRDSLRQASKASAIAVTRDGAAPSIPTLEEVDNTDMTGRELAFVT